MMDPSSSMEKDRFVTGLLNNGRKKSNQKAQDQGHNRDPMDSVQILELGIDTILKVLGSI